MEAVSYVNIECSFEKDIYKSFGSIFTFLILVTSTIVQTVTPNNNRVSENIIIFLWVAVVPFF